MKLYRPSEAFLDFRYKVFFLRSSWCVVEPEKSFGALRYKVFFPRSKPGQTKNRTTVRIRPLELRKYVSRPPDLSEIRMGSEFIRS